MTDDWRDDCVIETWPKRSLGGQQVGTTNGVKVTAEKYGLTVISLRGRSQHQNRIICLDMIEIALTYKDKFR